MKANKIIGLTGTSGAGKSTVAALMADYGCAVIDADKLSRQALASGSHLIPFVKAAFGNNVLNSDGSINRKELASLAFSSQENAKKLNEIVHPWVIYKTLEIIKWYREKQYELIVLDAPLLFESSIDAICDYVVVVTAAKDVRVERIIKRDQITEDEALLRINAQQNDSFYRRKSDFTILGDSDSDNIKRSVKEVIDKIRNS
ncbi:MAG: dephospho-CoA kinase [Bacillota bacterium]|nr:dephospho-CoA kinase [Bacillota bacterium]